MLGPKNPDPRQFESEIFAIGGKGKNGKLEILMKT